jgi:hypothetical protein
MAIIAPAAQLWLTEGAPLPACGAMINIRADAGMVNERMPSARDCSHRGAGGAAPQAVTWPRRAARSF